jgi:hypothetical protein
MVKPIAPIDVTLSEDDLARLNEVAAQSASRAESISYRGSDVEEWLAERKHEAPFIDPETAEVTWIYGQTLDPYGMIPDLPEELQQVGREYFARRPGSDIWVHFGDLPAEVREKLWKHPNSKPSFTVKTNGEVVWNIDPPMVGRLREHENLDPLL